MMAGQKKVEPDESDPVEYKGAEAQAQKEDQRKDADEPPEPEELPNTEGEPGKWKQKKKKTIVTRMPCHEPFEGHPKTKLKNPRDGGAGRGDEGHNQKG
jgi:hypothetical protein